MVALPVRGVLDLCAARDADGGHWGGACEIKGDIG
jgi:hypothetical protein